MDRQELTEAQMVACAFPIYRAAQAVNYHDYCWWEIKRMPLHERTNLLREWANGEVNEGNRDLIYAIDFVYNEHKSLQIKYISKRIKAFSRKKRHSENRLKRIEYLAIIAAFMKIKNAILN